jgi:uncharacterized membrane protein
VSAHVRELADLLVRWVHLIAGIMWVGNSMLFNWLDRNLEKSTDEAKDPRFEGRIWMVHSGGFYDVVKKQLPPGELPEPLHWFKWQNFTTWASGILLLVVVYYLGGGGLLIDPSVRAIGVGSAAGIGLGSIAAAWVVYDLLFKSPLAKAPAIAAAAGFAMLGALAAVLGHFLSARAAYIHVGVVIGTLMTGNVWFTIIPSQKELVAATKEGRAQDPAIGKRAKQRSIHNNYLTFPLLFIMISNHFPSTYGSPRAWAILGVLTFGGALVRHFMNIRFTWREGWFPAAAATVVVSVGALYALTKPAEAETSGHDRVRYADVSAIVERRCVACHSDHPTDEVWRVAPVGVKLDRAERVQLQAARIKERAVVQKTMPLGNKTGITDDERATLGAWIDQGAHTD